MEFDSWLKIFAERSSNPFVRDSETMIRYLFELDKKLPSTYGWDSTSVQELSSRLEKANSTEEFNSIYWRELARDIKAYGVMVVWRSTGLMKTALTSLNLHEIMAPAVLSRSLLELATTAISNANTIQETVEDILASKQSRVAVITCGELEALLNRIIHGTRIGEPPEHLKQTNVLTYISQVSKHPDAKDLPRLYEYLCDLAHPNVLGNARFWASVEKKKGSSGRMIVMQRYAESAITEDTRQKILWALGWSAACIRNSFELGRKAVKDILDRWPKR